MTLPQCLVTGGLICPMPSAKPPVIVKQAIVGVMDPCTIVTPPGPGTLSIQSFALNNPAGPLELGTPVLLPDFLAAYLGTPTGITMTDNQGNPTENIALPGLAFASIYNYPSGLLAPGSITWQLDITDGVNNDQDTVALAFQPRQFIGWTTNPGPYTEADLLALNQLTSVLSPTATFNLTLNPDDGAGGGLGGAYVVHGYLDALGPRVGTQYVIGGGFPGGFSEIQNGELVTVGGGNQLGYRVSRTNLGQQSPGGTLYTGNP